MKVTGQRLSKTGNRHLATDSWSPTNPKKETLWNHRFSCVISYIIAENLPQKIFKKTQYFQMSAIRMTADISTGTMRTKPQ